MIHISKHAPAETAGQAVTDAYLFLVFLCLPLVVHQGYYDITETKFLFFLGVGALYVLSILFLWFCGRRAAFPFRPVKALMAADIGMGAFAAAYIASSLYSGGLGPWLGIGARYQGGMTALCYALVYACVSRNFRISKLGITGLVTGFSLCCLLALVNDFGVDPLGMMRALPVDQRWQFVSTLGNTNFYSAYAGSLLPVALLFWCLAETRFYRILSGAAMLCGFCGLLPTASESGMLALLAALWLSPLFLMERPRALRRFLTALLAMLAVLGGLRLLYQYLPHVYYLSFSLNSLTRPAPLATLALLCLCLLLALRKREAPLRCQKAYIGVSLALAALGILALTVINTAFAARSFGWLDRFIKLNENWGTDRGRIWTYCIRAYGAFPLFQKLIGAGPGFLMQYDSLHPLFPDAILDSAHNEYLNYLLAVGIVGFAGYLCWITGVIKAAFARRGGAPLALAFGMGALAYAVQAIVNIAQPISTPFLFLLLAMAAGCATIPQSASVAAAFPPRSYITGGSPTGSEGAAATPSSPSPATSEATE